MTSDSSPHPSRVRGRSRTIGSTSTSQYPGRDITGDNKADFRRHDSTPGHRPGAFCEPCQAASLSGASEVSAAGLPEPGAICSAFDLQPFPRLPGTCAPRCRWSRAPSCAPAGEHRAPCLDLSLARALRVRRAPRRDSRPFPWRSGERPASLPAPAGSGSRPGAPEARLPSGGRRLPGGCRQEAAQRDFVVTTRSRRSSDGLCPRGVLLLAVGPGDLDVCQRCLPS